MAIDCPGGCGRAIANKFAKQFSVDQCKTCNEELVRR